jgi:serine/threonine protein kinase
VHRGTPTGDMIGQTISHYQVVARLGGGGMGVVYQARDLRLDRLVALKVLPPELTRDAEAKARFVPRAGVLPRRDVEADERAVT